MSLEDEKFKVTHPFELLRLAAHGSEMEQMLARAEYDRRIEEEPHAADSYRALRSLYFVATTHAFAVVQASALSRYARASTAAPWFIGLNATGDPLPEA